ncbi:phage terminase large subunit family protein [Priestia megaterium]
MYQLNGQALRFTQGRNYLKPIHNAEIEEILMMTGRQVEKSTTESIKIANNVLLRSFSRSLYVAPMNEQVKTFSRSRLDKLFRYSQDDIIRKRYMSADLVNQVFHKEFTNGAEIYLRNCFEEADNIRGLSIDDIFIDEIQDIVVDALPVIMETQTRSKNKHRIYTGTPKTFSNTIQQQWDKSSQADWVIRCLACGKHQVMGVDSVQPHAYVCRNPRCKKPIPDIVRAMGRWEHRHPNRKLKGFRITQMMVPDIAPNEIYDKIENYPLIRLKNEVLGESYEKADKPFTKSFMLEITDTAFSMLTRVTNTAFANTPTFLGVDWGEGEKNGEAGTGYTIMVVGAYNAEGKFQILYSKRFEKGKDLDPDYQINQLYRIADAFRCKFIVADYGAGVKENKRIFKRFGATRFAQCQYVGQQKVKVNYNPLEFKFLIERSDWMTDFIDFCNDGNLRLFGQDDEGMLDVFYDNFTAIYSEYRKASNGLAERLFYGHDITQPDDAFHATLYAWFASKMYRNGAFVPKAAGGNKGKESIFKSVKANAY